MAGSKFVVCVCVCMHHTNSIAPFESDLPLGICGESPARLNLSTGCIWFIPASIREPPLNTITTHRERVRRLSTKLIGISLTTAAGTQARAKGFKHHCFPIGLKGGEKGEGNDLDVWVSADVISAERDARAPFHSPHLPPSLHPPSTLLQKDKGERASCKMQFGRERDGWRGKGQKSQNHGRPLECTCVYVYPPFRSGHRYQLAPAWYIPVGAKRKLMRNSGGFIRCLAVKRAPENIPSNRRVLTGGIKSFNLQCLAENASKQGEISGGEMRNSQF